MIRGTVCRNLERRSGRMAAGCAKVNGIAVEDWQISPVTRKYLVQVGSRCPTWTLVINRGSSPGPGGVVLLAVYAGTLPVFGPLNAALFSRANMTIGRRVGFLAIDVGLATLQ